MDAGHGLIQYFNPSFMPPSFRGKFSDLFKRGATEIQIMREVKAVRMLPVLFAYGLAIVALLRISQVVLGWSF